MPNRSKAIRQIPFFNYAAMTLEHGEEIVNAIKDVLSRGAFILQKDLEEFEQRFACYLKVKHAIGLANCTDALIMALRAAGIDRGDEVIFPSHTFVATASAIYFNGAVPVPVDCGADHLMDPCLIEAAITSKTRAILPVQLNGRVCDMDAIGNTAKKHGLIIIEDAAQALGGMFKGRMAGTFGLAGCFSFYPAKTLGCFGDGGALVTNSDEIARKIRLMRDHGRSEKGEYCLWGVNSRLDNLQAAILNVKLTHYEKAIEKRREIAGIYSSRLGGVKQLVLPPAPESTPDHFDIYQNYEIEAEHRDELRSFLANQGIKTIVQWGGIAVHQMHDLGFEITLPKTERVSARSLLLPMNTMISAVDIDYICDRIMQFYRK